MSERIDIFGVEPVVKIKGVEIKGVEQIAKIDLGAALAWALNEDGYIDMTNNPWDMDGLADRYREAQGEPAILVDTPATQVVRVGPDLVNHPAHYTKGKIEVIEILESIVSSMELTPTEAGRTWSVVKYMARWKNKGGAEDLKKAEWYLKRLIREVGE